jgi:serine/threonine-protein kinase
MPPEQALGRSREIDGQTDLWAVGATMFTLASGHFVHEAETLEEMLVHSGSRPARPIASVLPDIAPTIGSVIDRALAFRRDERWPDAQTMRAALAGAYAAVYGATLPGSRVPGIPPVDAYAATAAVSAGPIAAASGGAPHGTPHLPRPVPSAETVGSGTQLATELGVGRPALQMPPPAARGISTTAGLSRGEPEAVEGTPARAPRGSGAAIAVLVGVASMLLAGGGVYFALQRQAAREAGRAPAETSVAASPALATAATAPATPPDVAPTASSSSGAPGTSAQDGSTTRPIAVVTQGRSPAPAVKAPAGHHDGAAPATETPAQHRHGAQRGL